MRKPRVLLCARPDLLSKPGGDSHQILGLKRLLHGAELSLRLLPRLSAFDVVHVFNLSRPLEPALQAVSAHRAGLPVICTPAFQELDAYNRFGRFGLGRFLLRTGGLSDDALEDLRAMGHLLGHGIEGVRAIFRLGLGSSASSAGQEEAPASGQQVNLHVRLQESLLTLSRVLVTNSSLEEEALSHHFSAPLLAGKSDRAPVGIDPDEFATLDGRAFKERFSLDRFVLCVARIEDLKNQLGLIQALAEEPIPLVIIGGINPWHRRYARAVATAAARRPNTLFLPGLERSGVLSAMAAASVHVLPSWFETAGLVSLEAAASGCAVVSTERGYARAFLEEDAGYCDPARPQSIRAAVLQTLARGPAPRLRERVLDLFTLPRVAAKMEQIYRGVIA